MPGVTFDLANMSEETRGEIYGLMNEGRDARGTGRPAPAIIQALRDFSTATGLNWYDLQRPAKTLKPVITLLLNMIPSAPGNGDVRTNWRAVTDWNTGKIRGGVPEGQRAARHDVVTAARSAAYKTIGAEDRLTFEGAHSARGFEDLRARMAMQNLYEHKLRQEFILLGGNGPNDSGGEDDSQALGTPSTPTVTGSHSGTGQSGNFVNGTAYSVVAVALTLDGRDRSSVTAGVFGLLSYTGADGETYTTGGGSSNPSASGAVTTGGGSPDYVLNASVPVVPNAVGYAWYVGVAGSERLSQITTLNSAIIQTIPLTPKQLLSALVTLQGGVDQSIDTGVYSGLLTLASKLGLVTSLATGVPGVGTTLTADGAGGIIEIETMLQSYWDTLNISPTHIFVNSQQAKDIDNKVIAGGSAPLFRFQMDAGANADVLAARAVGRYFNRYSPDGKILNIQIHPKMPPGTILFVTDALPGYYPDNNTGSLYERHVREDYYEIDWPLTSRRWPIGVYIEETLASYFPPSLGLIRNIAPG